MGVCVSERQKYKSKMSLNQTQEDYKVNETEESKFYTQEKTTISRIPNKIIEISLNSKKTIIKTIGNIKGELIMIKNNINCIILIMDYSYSITIQNCQNCSILLGPCQTLIEVEDCQNLNIISISLNLKIVNVKESNFFSFVSNSPIIESSEKINLGHFFIQYMELPEMFVKSKLNIWNNKWSNYKEIGDINFEIKYADEKIKQNIIDVFMNIFPKCYINIDQFQFMPFTYGKSIDTENYNNFLIILRQEDFPEGEILKMILPEEIENYSMKLISTLIVKENSNIFKKLIKQLEGNKENNNLINYLLRINDNNNEDNDSSQNSQEKDNNKYNHNNSISTTNKNRLNEFDLSNNDIYMNNNNLKFLQKKDFLFLWFVHENDDFGEINDYFNSFFEPLYVYIISKQQFNLDDEGMFQKKLIKIFGINN